MGSQSFRLPFPGVRLGHSGLPGTSVKHVEVQGGARGPVVAATRGKRLVVHFPCAKSVDRGQEFRACLTQGVACFFFPDQQLLVVWPGSESVLLALRQRSALENGFTERSLDLAGRVFRHSHGYVELRLRQGYIVTGTDQVLLCLRQMYSCAEHVRK